MVSVSMGLELTSVVEAYDVVINVLEYFVETASVIACPGTGVTV